LRCSLSSNLAPGSPTLYIPREHSSPLFCRACSEVTVHGPACPNGKYDEQADSTAQALGWMRDCLGKGIYGLTEYMKQQIAKDLLAQGSRRSPVIPKPDRCPQCDCGGLAGCRRSGGASAAVSSSGGRCGESLRLPIFASACESLSVPGRMTPPRMGTVLVGEHCQTVGASAESLCLPIIASARESLLRSA